MKDRLERNINYMRISITDRCNLRCKYCMPDPVADISHGDILRFEEILQITDVAVQLGIDRFKITGGEPLVRKGAAEFVEKLKKQPGVQCVTLTTNGIYLVEALPALKKAGIDGINISLDALDAQCYRDITGKDGLEQVLESIGKCVEYKIPTKINAVMLEQNRGQWNQLAMLAENMPVDVRFIELMPIGYGKYMSGIDGDAILKQLKSQYEDLHYVDEKRGNGPAIYYRSKYLQGRIGLIRANSHQFCDTCNRVRLTSDGMMKPCLCYEEGVNLRDLLRSQISQEALKQAIQRVIYQKPAAHCFAQKEDITEHKLMSSIGG